jgi:hypothetical protein
MTPEDLIRQALPEELVSEALTWELVPYEDEGLKAVGVIKGMEFHVHLAPGVKFKRHKMREALRPLFERWGFLTTRTKLGDEARLLKLFGFEPTWDDGCIQYWMMTALPFERK